MYSIYVDGAAGNNIDNVIYKNRDDCILNMITIKDDFVWAANWENNIEDIHIQKEYHDLDCYLVAFRIFVKGKFAALIQLNELKVIG